MSEDQLKLKRFVLIVVQKAAEGIAGGSSATVGLNKLESYIIYADVAKSQTE